MPRDNDVADVTVVTLTFLNHARRGCHLRKLTENLVSV